ncbi:MAG: hypothetical protein GY697_22870 [Desulfobacterales bacterium]|nr:hypothetical protein [Desulfobacterales bacterium]
MGDFEKVKQLLANGANVNAIIPDDMGVVDYVPLNMAICSKNFNLDIISELLIAGANVKYTGDSHDILTNLVNCRRSSEEKLMEAAELLISFGAKVDTVTDTIGPAYALAEADGLIKLAQLMQSYSEK